MFGLRAGGSTRQWVNDLVNGGRPTLELFPLGLASTVGQDRLGRDTFAQTMRGVQSRFAVMFLIGLVGGAIGVVVGALSGYFCGWYEAVLMRLTDVVIVIPLIIIAAVMGEVAVAP